MDQEDYINKANILLQDTSTYKLLKKDPTNSLKNKLITILKDIKQTGALNITKYKILYPTSAVPPKFYDLTKIHKAGTPLRPIVVQYGVHHLWGSQRAILHHQTTSRPVPKPSQKHPTFHPTIRGQNAGTRGGHHLLWCKGSFYFSSHLTIHPNCQTKATTGHHTTTKHLHVHTTNHHPMEFCLTNTYFLFQGKYYEQVQGAAMGSPISPHSQHLHGRVWGTCPQHLPLAKVCWWHLCHQQGRTQSGTTTAHQQPGPSHPIHNGTNTTRLASLSGHPSHHWTKQHLQHNSLQETHTHRWISPLGQQSPHHSQPKCLQYTSPQSKSGFLFTGQI